MKRACALAAVLFVLGKDFTLRKGQEAREKDGTASVKVTGFVDSPCPKGVRCIWSGQSVLLSYAVSGATVAPASFPYEVKVVKSDYKKKATLKALARPLQP